MSGGSESPWKHDGMVTSPLPSPPRAHELEASMEIQILYDIPGFPLARFCSLRSHNGARSGKTSIPLRKLEERPMHPGFRRGDLI